MRLLHFQALLEAGCPVGRHELTDSEWLMLGDLKAERERLSRGKKDTRGYH